MHFFRVWHSRRPGSGCVSSLPNPTTVELYEGPRSNAGRQSIPPRNAVISPSVQWKYPFVSRNRNFRTGVSKTFGAVNEIRSLALSRNLPCQCGQLRIRQRKGAKEIQSRERSRHVRRSNCFSRSRDSASGILLFKPVNNGQQALRKVMMSGSPRSRWEEAPVMERVKQNPLGGLLEGASNVFKADQLGTEIAIIALPALLALAADPLASLVDTGFIGQIGPVELGAVGVSISVFNLVSKMFNLPLVNITTSYVAEEEASAKAAQLRSPVAEPMVQKSSSLGDAELEENLPLTDTYTPTQRRPLLPAISSALVLGTALGVVEAVVMTLGAGPILTIMGVGTDSSMRVPAVQYLALRAIGAPATVVALAVQGVFRGFKDTKTPLFATVLGNVINIVLDPILMFSLKFGVSGAAAATVISQYVIALVLLWTLNERVTIVPPKFGDLRFDKFLKSGGLLLGRTLVLLLVMTLATSMAARQGAIPMAAHQICMQIWLAASLLSDSLALAGQAIIAGSFAKKDYRQVKEATFRVLQMGLGLGLIMALLLVVGTRYFSTLFTKDAGVLEFIALITPFVAITQPINSLAFVFDGILYGVSDFQYAAVAMIVIAIPSAALLLLASPLYALRGVWIGLATVMTLRMLAGFVRIGTCTGPWEFFLRENEEASLEDVELEDNPPS